MDSYHGCATRSGDGQAATCVDCHSAHLVLPAEDPISTISAEGVVSTCGACHEGADANFAASYDHKSASIEDNPINKIIRDIYIWLIVLVIGGMVVHNLVIMNYYMIKRRREQVGDQGTVVRFTFNEVLQHMALTVSFTLLAITGFALRFPEAWWVRGLSAMGMTEGIRGDIHRVSGVILILTSVYHTWYVAATKRGREEIKAIFPAWKDITDVIHNILYYTFRSKEKVKFGRYDYSQKAEYWALVWGTFVMAVTGLVLWFPILTARYLPALTIPASQTIHYYEAWLATLAIIVWHFFFVIFHPEEYPMSWTWITGKATKKFVKDHHRQWYEDEIEPLGDDDDEASPTLGD